LAGFHEIFAVSGGGKGAILSRAAAL
jgi:hypothetical protein